MSLQVPGKLYPLQDKALEAFTNQKFYLTGGTALSRFHYVPSTGPGELPGIY
ncbi:MAG: hypothetical protein GY757_60480 [bacterium]|nr:hypothetical protein [bacterium]